MSFAEEFAKVTSRGAQAAAPAAVATPAKGETQAPADSVMNDGLPDYNALEAVPQLPSGGKPEPEAPKPAAKFRIAGKEFATQDEAFAYAEQIALDKIQDDAFSEGKKVATEALTPKEQAVVRTILDDVEEKLFVDPKAALQLLQENLEKLIDAKAQEREEKAQKLQAKKEATEKLYKEFYTENPDIADFPEIVESVTQKHWSEIGTLPIKQGLARVAQETRNELKQLRERLTPQRELSSKPATVAGGGSGKAPAAVAESTAQSPMDFISQVNKHRKRA